MSRARTHLHVEFEPSSLPETFFWRYYDQEVMKRAGILELDFAILRFILLHLLHLLHQQLVPDAHSAHFLLLHLPSCCTFCLLLQALRQRDHCLQVRTIDGFQTKWTDSQNFCEAQDAILVHVWSISCSRNASQYKILKLLLKQPVTMISSSSSLPSSVQSSSCRSELWAPSQVSTYPPSGVVCWRDHWVLRECVSRCFFDRSGFH